MNSQDGDRVYLKPGVVENIPETDVRSRSFFGNNMYQIVGFYDYLEQ